MGGVLAIDFGARKSGFAATDALRIARAPLTAVRHPGSGPELLEHVARLLAERSVATILVGLPLRTGDSPADEGQQARAVRAFAARLAARFPDHRVLLHDEHGTTKEAEGRLHEAGYRGPEIRARKDSWSALVLLEDWIRSGEPEDGLVPPPPAPRAPGDG